MNTIFLRVTVRLTPASTPPPFPGLAEMSCLYLSLMADYAIGGQQKSQWCTFGASTAQWWPRWFCCSGSGSQLDRETQSKCKEDGKTKGWVTQLLHDVPWDKSGSQVDSKAWGRVLDATFSHWMYKACCSHFFLTFLQATYRLLLDENIWGKNLYFSSVYPIQGNSKPLLILTWKGGEKA